MEQRQVLQNKIRGLIGAIRARRKSGEEFDITGYFQSRIRDILLEAREQIADDKFSDFADWVHVQLRAQISPTLLNAPNSPQQLMSVRRAHPLPLARELSSAATRLRQAAQQISEFRKHASELEEAYLRGRHEVAMAKLGDIFSRFGYSVWHIEAEVALVQLAAGLEEQKHVSERIKKVGQKSILSFLTHNISVRNEPNTTPSGFYDTLAPRIARFDLSMDLKSYLRHRLFDPFEITARTAGSLLRVAQGQSIIDLYETYIEIVQALLVNQRAGLLHQNLLNSLRELDEITDWRLAKARVMLGDELALEKLHIGSDATYDVLFDGRISDAYRTSLQLLREHPEDLSSLLVASTAKAINGSVRKRNGRIISTERIDRLSRVLLKANDFHQTGTSSYKLYRNLSVFPSTRALAFIFRDDELMRRPLPSNRALKIAALNNPRFSLEDIKFALDAGVGSQTIQKFCPRIYEQYTRLARESEEGVSLMVRTLRALTQLTVGQTFDARLVVNSLREIDGQAAQTFALLVGLEYNAKGGNLAQAIDIAVSAIISRPDLHEALDLPRLFPALNWEELSQIDDVLSVAVFLDFFARESGDAEITTMCRFAFDEFLETNNYKKPTEVALELDRFDRHRIIYFLRNVCIKSVMDMNLNFENSREIDDERINICALLSRLDSGRTQEYQDEIFELSYSMMIEKGIRLVDSSRIHVDEAAIERWARKELSEQHSRYVDLTRAGIGISANFEEVVRNIARRTLAERAEMMVPANEADDLLVRMVRAIRDKFINDPSHGLDSYLSKRVRHGSVLHHIRNPVERESLITQRISNDHNRYESNHSWRRRLSMLSPEQLAQLDRVLAEFSRRFDNIILDLKDNRLHVRSLEFPKGLIDVELSAAAYELLKAAIKDDMDLDALVNGTMAILWGLLGASLDKVRNHLRTTVKSEIAEAFDRLRLSLRKLARDNPQLAVLSNAVGTASAATQGQIEIIASWFTKPMSQEAGQLYTLNQAVAVCLASSIRCFGSLSDKLQNRVTDKVSISGEEIIKINEIIWVMIQNIHDHAQMTSPEVIITGDFYAEQEIVRFRCVSEVGEGVNCDTAEARLNDIRTAIADGTYKDRVRTDIKSGFSKLADLVGQSPKGRLEFGFFEEMYFYVEVDVSLILEPYATVADGQSPEAAREKSNVSASG